MVSRKVAQGMRPPRSPRTRRIRNDSGSAAATERISLVEQYQDFVGVVVSKLMRTMRLPSTLREDFIAAGYLGLVEAADRYDPRKGAEFRSFAFLRIRGAVIDHVRSCCELNGQGYRMLKALEAAQDLSDERAAGTAKSGFEQSESDSPDKDRLTHALEFLAKSAVAYKLAATKPFSDEFECAEDPEQTLLKKSESEKIRTIVATLPEKERTIIEQYYFHDRKMVEVAKHYAGLSKSWVSRLHDRAISLLRERYFESTEHES